MTVAEDFQFSHKGVPPLELALLRKYALFFCSKIEFTQKNLRHRIFPLVPFWKLRIEEGRVHALQESAICRPVKKAWPLRQRGMPGKKITRRRRVRRGIAE